MFFGHNGMKLEIKNKEFGEIHKYMGNNTVSNKHWVKEEITKTEYTMKRMKVKMQHTKTYGMQLKQYLEGNVQL